MADVGSGTFTRRASGGTARTRHPLGPVGTGLAEAVADRLAEVVRAELPLR